MPALNEINFFEKLTLALMSLESNRLSELEHNSNQIIFGEPEKDTWQISDISQTNHYVFQFAPRPVAISYF